MIKEITNIETVERLDALAINMMDSAYLHRLQEEMAANNIALFRKDYWTADVLAKKTKDAASIQKALYEMKAEPSEKKVLHLLQMVMQTAPGAATGVKQFLKRVTFA